MAFGLASSFVPYYVFGTIVAGSPALGPTYIGALSALIVAAAAVAAASSGMASSSFSTAAAAGVDSSREYSERSWIKVALMVAGGICLAATGGAMLVWENKDLGTWSAIVPLLLAYGTGRGIWESTNKAVVADLYSGAPTAVQESQAAAAFAAVAFSSGAAGAAGYFTFPRLPRSSNAALIAGISVAAIILYLLSLVIYRHRAQKAIDAGKKEDGRVAT